MAKFVRIIPHLKLLNTGRWQYAEKRINKANGVAWRRDKSIIYADEKIIPELLKLAQESGGVVINA